MDEKIFCFFPITPKKKKKKKKSLNFLFLSFFKVSYQSGTRIHLCTKSKSALGITAIKLEHFNHPDIGENGKIAMIVLSCYY